MTARSWLLALSGLAVALLLAAFGVLGALAPPPPLAVPERGARFENVTVVVPGSGRLAARRVRVEGERIAAVEDAAPGSEPAGFLLPGLIDMHVHPADWSIAGQRELFALLYLAHGVTAVRHTGGYDRDGVAAIEAGALAGPRSFACGPLHDGEPPIWPGSVVVETEAQARSAVERLVANGFDCVKVYERLTPEALAALRAAAHEHGLPVVGHVPVAVPFAEAGIDDVQHLRGVAGRTPGTVDPMARLGARAVIWRRLRDDRLEWAVRHSREQGVAHTPTLVLTLQAGRLADVDSLLQDPPLRLLPRFYADITWNPVGTPFHTEETKSVYPAMGVALEFQQRMVRALHEAGVRIHAGTDVGNPYIVPGASLHQELRLLAESGLGAEGALAAATGRTPLLIRAPTLGEIAPGAPADLLLFREDPTLDLAALESLTAVVADGRLYPKSDLDAAVARSQDHYRGWLYETVSMTIGRQRRARALRQAREAPTPR